MNEEPTIWTKANELLRELDIEPPENGTKLKYCLTYLDRAIEKVKELKQNLEGLREKE